MLSLTKFSLTNIPNQDLKPAKSEERIQTCVFMIQTFFLLPTLPRDNDMV